MSGIKVGVSNLYYAVMNEDETYQTPVKLAGLIDLSRKVASDTASLYADNGPFATATSLGEITVEISVADVPPAHLAVLLGHTKTGPYLDGHKDDSPPYVALMFEGLLDNGHKRYKKLYKGRFTIPDDDYKTKGDNVEFQPQKISGKFVIRETDGKYERTVDTNDQDYVASIGANWYTAVLDTSDSTPPTVSCVPANSATGVAVSASVVLTFSEAMAASSVVAGESFMLVRSSDMALVAGNGTWNTGRTVYTFKPTANLTASTQYQAILSQGIRDLAGNKPAAINRFSFTTA